MPKQKTRKSLAKRFKMTKRGKILFRGSGIRHLRANKSKKRIRRQKVLRAVATGMAKKMKKILH